MIRCDSCDYWYHSTCLKGNTAGYAGVNASRPWLCTLCMPVTGDIHVHNIPSDTNISATAPEQGKIPINILYNAFYNS